MTKARELWFAILLGLAVYCLVVLAADHAYIGGSKCMMCHKLAKGGEVWQVWEGTAHAKAFESLSVEKGDTENPKCLKCHTTGYAAGGYVPGDTTMNLKGVQCEACHGAGADYKLTHSKAETREKAYAEQGLMKPDEKTCLGCHNEENPNQPAEPWNYEKMWAKIEHHLPTE